MTGEGIPRDRKGPNIAGKQEETRPMSITIRQVGPCLAGEVDGTRHAHAAVARGRGRHPCWHGPLCGPGVPRPEDRRRPAARLHPGAGPDRACDRHQPARCQRGPPAGRPLPTSPTSTRPTCRSPATTAAACSRSAIACGIPTPRSRRRPTKYRCCTRSAFPSRAATRQFADMRAAYDALDEETKTRSQDLVCEHSQMYSRQLIGFMDFTDEERPALQAGAPVHGAHPSGDRPQVALSFEPCRRGSSAGRCPRRAASCAT